MELIRLGKRQLLSVGASVVVTLPKNFCQAYGWKAGEIVEFKTDGKQLILTKIEDGGDE